MISSTRSRYLPTCFESTPVRTAAEFSETSHLLFGPLLDELFQQALVRSNPFSAGESGKAGLISSSRNVIKRWRKASIRLAFCFSSL